MTASRMTAAVMTGMATEPARHIPVMRPHTRIYADDISRLPATFSSSLREWVAKGPGLLYGEKGKEERRLNSRAGELARG
jgi:hypothetical protein